MERHPVHVLLVEDDHTHASIVEKAFQRADEHGTLHHVEDGEDAIKYVERESPYQDRPRPDLILLDLHLPSADGHHVLQCLKTDDALKTIPVVVLTTSDAEDDRRKAYQLHANSYLVKPANFAEFRDMIAATIDYWGNWNCRPECEK